jgi:hypothetical protein
MVSGRYGRSTYVSLSLVLFSIALIAIHFYSLPEQPQLSISEDSLMMLGLKKQPNSQGGHEIISRTSNTVPVESASQIIHITMKGTISSFLL